MRPDKEKRVLKFAQAVANGSTYTDAYMIAYPNSDKWARRTLANKASNFAKTPEVQIQIQKLTASIQAVAEENTICQAQELRELLSGMIRDNKIAPDVRIRAIKQLADMSGYNAPTITETRIKIRAENISDEELRRIAYGTD